jgi:molybdenum cofactor biosynthesis protein B
MRPRSGQPRFRAQPGRGSPAHPGGRVILAPVSAEEHKRQAPALADIRIAIVTVSDTRTAETDVGGQLLRDLCQQAGAVVTGAVILPDDAARVAAHVRALVTGNDGEGHAIHAVLLTGGTGIARRDTTVEALAGLFDKTLDGFGELFRMLSFQEVGAAAMLSRATAGVIAGVAVFLMPGSPKAVRLAMERLILPELGHLVGQLGGRGPGGAHAHR